jgi:chromate transporter
MVYLTLIYEFAKTGLFSIGGGLATLPFLYQLADRYPWFTRETLIDMIAISESTPGPIGLNVATYAGYSASGALGGVLASLSVILPSFFIISLIVKILESFKENRFVKSAFYGIRPAVTALIASAALGIVKITLLDVPAFRETHLLLDIFNYKQWGLFFLIFYLTRKFNKHPVYYIGGAALIGVVFKF